MSWNVYLFDSSLILSMWGRHSVILYFGIFPTILFGLLSIQSLLYTPIFLVFTPNYFSIICHPVLPRAQCANEGGGGLHGWSIIICGFARIIILAHNLMCQPEARCRVPVWIPVLQGTGKLISKDHSWLQYCNRNCDSSVYPAPHVRNGFVHFFCHDSTQIHEYEQVLLT